MTESNLSSLGVKFAAYSTPSVDADRPSHCGQCGVACGLLGELRIHGHGTSERSVSVGERGHSYDILVRRYRCVVCGSTMTVLPSELEPRCLYLLPVKFAALFAWCTGASAREVRARYSQQRSYDAGSGRDWASLRRWARELGGTDAEANAPKQRATAAIARRIARAPPGTIALHSEPGCKTTRSHVF